jgi:2-polyprenyl-3-methyl-5-hydroxy-6-metoxy-1,4-benzoquinol methylase
MKIKHCRICHNKFFLEPLLHYENMPKSAQYLPDSFSLKTDKGIVLKVYQCSGCGVVQLINEPVFYYKEVIRSSSFSKEMINFRKKQFDKFINKYNLKAKKIIEIGCGKGEYLSIVSKFDIKAYGLEYSLQSVEYCRKKGLNVFRGFIDNSNYVIKNSPFNAFYILSFLEHIPQPNIFLRGLYNNLTDEAIGIIEVPNFNMILKEKLFSEFIRDHIFYFTKSTLSTTLAINGFDIIECKEIWHNYIISAIVKKRKKLDISDFCNFKNKLIKQIEDFLTKFKDKKVAVWGAGHQAFTILSLIKTRKNIEYIIDSATFKQQKFSPATHIPIVSPDTLNSKPADAIIIMAGSYSDEIANILNKKFNKKLTVAIVRNSELQLI